MELWKTAPINIQQMRASFWHWRKGLSSDVMKKKNWLRQMANETNSAVCKSTLQGELRVVLAELSSGIERELDLGTGEVIEAAAAFDDSGMGSGGESSQSRSKRGTRKVAKRKKSGAG